MTTDLISTIKSDMKEAMKAKEATRLGAIRMLLSEIKKVEIDQRKTLTDTDILTIINKMIKQRKDSEQQFIDANRPELADKEHAEIIALTTYLPEPLSEQEVLHIISSAIAESDAKSMQDMGKVIAKVKPELVGRADMSQVSGWIREKLQG